MFFAIIRPSIIALISFSFSFIKLLPIVGSFFGYFSTHAILLPTTGLIGGPLSPCIYLLFKLLLCKATLYKAIFYQLLNNVGGLAANISWSNNKIINLTIIFVCFVFFLVHPTGSQVPLYTLYWIIPCLLITTNQQSLFLRSFNATWIAHAVGSVVWLYVHNVSIAQWAFLTINPFVVGERVILALGIMACVYIAQFIEQLIYSLAKQRLSSKIKVIE